MKNNTQFLALDLNQNEPYRVFLQALVDRGYFHAVKHVIGLNRQSAVRVFIDMDGVTVDFDGYMEHNNLTAAEVKKLPGAYLGMKPIGGALESIRELITLGFEVWLATKPPTGIAHAYSDKAAWVFEHLPELSQRIIITHDKGLLGSEVDFLLDDRPHKANCLQFAGALLQIGPGAGLTEVLPFFRLLSEYLSKQPA